ncbi:helix-turn-helix transcriptional regulator [Sphaerisporangium aureirubrum]|uniref:Helix-turn-helix transcriptional regulator n=1 Tax=Sphaerisporangium aureirubrum TaxID=1544736 RepID=A0ABW1NA35_9ACTN
MNRTDRLYALVEELRAISPRCRSARQLSEGFGVSVRTVERDIATLQRAGVPIRAEAGRRGGYTIGQSPAPPPIDLTPAEAVAVAVALSRAGKRPFAAHARSALRKLVAATPVPAETPGHPLPGEVISARRAAIARVISGALLRTEVLRITYDDRAGKSTERDVEPGVFIGGRGGLWYLVAWCRLRQDVRVFRLDRIGSAAATGEPAWPRKQLEEYVPDIPDIVARDRVLD